jgi:hypothetical protein
VVLFTFIVTVLSVPPTLVANWQLMRSAVRWGRVRFERRVKRDEAGHSDLFSALKRQIVKVELAYGKLNETPTPPSCTRRKSCCGPATGNRADEVSTSAVADDIRGYMEVMTSQPRPGALPLHNGRWSAGTAATP